MVDVPVMRIEAVVVVPSNLTLYAACDEIVVPPITLSVKAFTAPTMEIVALPSTIVVAAANKKNVVVVVDPKRSRAKLLPDDSVAAEPVTDT